MNTKQLGLACVLSIVGLAGTGCGSDEATTMPMAATGAMACAAGAAAATPPAAAGAASGMECISKTATKLGGGPAMGCAQCVCSKSPALALACVNTTECWDLIQCGGEHNCAPGGMLDIGCIMTNCAMFIDDAASVGAAMPFGAPVVATMCTAECVDAQAAAMPVPMP